LVRRTPVINGLLRARGNTEARVAEMLAGAKDAGFAARKHEG